MAEIFYNGKIYVGALSKHEYENVFNEGSDKLWVEYLNEIPDIRKYPIIGTHSFKDGQDVTGLWTVQYQCQCGRKEKHTINHCENVVMVAVPKSTTPPDELDKEAKELVFSNDDLDRIGNVKLIKFLLGRIDALKPKNKSQEVAIEAIKSMITETDYFKNGKSLIHIENENAGSLEYALNKFHAINDTDLQPRAMQPTEAQRLIDMFYEKMAFQSTELRRHEIAKQCAIIHCDLMIEYLNKNRLSNYANHYTTLKQKIEAL